ncbi:MAG: ABC transporter permease [Chloroflexota bacterium]
MTAHVLRRLVHLVPVLLIVSAVVFFVFRIIPGDAAILLLYTGEGTVDPEDLAALRRNMGLDKPVYVQYLIWLGNALRGDLGVSYINQQPVSSLLLEKLPASLELGLLGMLLALVISLPVGILSALWRGSWLDQVARVLALLGFCMPRYFLAVLLIMVFAVNARWVPPAGYVDLLEDPVRNLHHAALPVLSVAITMAAVQMRFLRSSLLDVIGQDYIRTAHGKGLSFRAVVTDHALKNALIPFVTVVGLGMGHMLGGLVLVEQIFSWPGVGWLLMQSIVQRDFAVVQGAVLLITVGFVFINLLVDISYALLDPRIRYE